MSPINWRHGFWRVTLVVWACGLVGWMVIVEEGFHRIDPSGEARPTERPQGPAEWFDLEIPDQRAALRRARASSSRPDPLYPGSGVRVAQGI
jgi:hypothetical protein